MDKTIIILICLKNIGIKINKYTLLFILEYSEIFYDFSVNFMLKYTINLEKIYMFRKELNIEDIPSLEGIFMLEIISKEWANMFIKKDYETIKTMTFPKDNIYLIDAIFETADIDAINYLFSIGIVPTKKYNFYNTNNIEFIKKYGNSETIQYSALLLKGNLSTITIINLIKKL